jgi:hypothetical protein
LEPVVFDRQTFQNGRYFAQMIKKHL